MVKYKAKLHQKDSTEDGFLKIENEKLIFYNEKIEINIKKSEISVRKNETGAFFISKTGDDAFKFSTEEYSILRDDFFKTNVEKIQRASSIHRHKKWVNIFLFGILGSILIVIGILIFFRKNIVDSVVAKIPTSVEEKIGRSYIEQMKKNSELDTSTILNDSLNLRINTLLKSINIQYDLKIYISNSEEVNAFALPGGHIVFNKGLLKMAASWEEVLGVAAHEAAHMTEKHHLRGLVSKFGVFNLLRLFIGDGGAMHDLILTSGAKLDELANSREFEEEADLKGFEYLMNAKINPEGMKIFFTKLDKLKDNHKVPEFMNTHPSTSARIDIIDNMLKESGNNKFIALGEYEPFKSNL